MVRSKRLKPIRKMAQSHEKQAAQALGKSLQQQSEQTQKLAQLQQYKNEYLEEMQTKVKLGVSGESLQRYHLFLDKLEQAIGQQQQAVLQSEQDLNASQGRWQEKSSRHKVITKTIDKMKQNEKQQRDKKETHLIDELSTQAFLRGR